MFLWVTVATLPLENKVSCMAYALFLSVVLDFESEETNEKSTVIHKKCIKNLPSRGNFAEPV